MEKSGNTLNQFRQEIESDSGQNVQLNKGHYNLDSPERMALFSKKMAENWEEGYRKYRESWEEMPKQRKVGEYPVLVDIELASNCNLRCPMCYTTTQHFKDNVKRKLMRWDLYKKVIDEIAYNVPAVRLSWRGESTLHNKFVEAVEYAKSRGIGEISFLTNGYRLELDYFKRLVDAGADWITVSFDGVGEEYNKIRAPLKYEDTLKMLKDAMNYKRERGLNKPLIKVQGIWPSIRHDPQGFYDTMKEASDLVAFNPLIDYLGIDNEEDIIFEENFACPQIFQRLFVSSTGDVMMCNSDEYGEEIVGNATFQTIHEIWHGAPLTKIREAHGRTDGFKEIPLCKKCFYPRKTEVSETAMVDGRKVLIENYINRKQEVDTSIKYGKKPPRKKVS